MEIEAAAAAKRAKMEKTSVKKKKAADEAFWSNYIYIIIYTIIYIIYENNLEFWKINNLDF